VAAVAITTAACRTGAAQDSIPWPAANHLAVTVAVEVQSVRDSVALTYTIRNDARSEQAAQAFALRLDVKDYRISGPGGWVADPGVIQDSSAALWYAGRKAALIRPGSSLGPFVLRGTGLVASVTYRIEGDYAPPVYNDSTGQPIQHATSFWINSVPGRTIGLIPIPADSSPTGLLRAVQSVLAHFCGAASGASGICTSLNAKLAAASDALARGERVAAADDIRAFRQELASSAATALGSGVSTALQIDADQILKRL